MGKDSGTKCSHCGKNGHNSRTCGSGGVGGGGGGGGGGVGSKSVRIFGVKMSPNKKEDPMKKSFSMGNLPAIVAELAGDDDIGRGYLSDGPLRSKKEGSHERKKGVPWTAEEHRTFLEGLKKLGKGDWRGISRSYVTTRTPTQVASHAQKYFLRQTAANKKKRRASLFDMAIKETGETSNSALKDSDNYPKQAGSSVQVGNQAAASHGIQALPTIPMARTPSIPQINNIPYMVGPPGFMKPEGYSASVSVVPVVNICNVGYSYQPKHQNSYAGYTPFPSQPYITSFSPPAVQHCAVKLEPNSSSAVNTDLKLSTTPTEVGDRTKLPTHSSNMNGAIGVI